MGVRERGYKVNSYCSNVLRLFIVHVSILWEKTSGVVAINEKLLFTLN